tara:strand:- start:13 stop:126 length:114 start_codon:yes stop_codon:yes gene_type:complete
LKTVLVNAAALLLQIALELAMEVQWLMIAAYVVVMVL